MKRGSTGGAGGLSGIEHLYRQHWDALCKWLRWRYGAGPPEPEDIAQAAFMKLAEVDQGSLQDPRAYLFTIASNTALSGFRWFSRTQRFIDNELEENGYRLEELSPERVCTSRERLELVLEQLDTLSDKQREIIMRSRIGGQTYEAISADTGWSIADISRQLTAAMAELRAHLARHDGEGPVDTARLRRRSS